MKTFDQGYVNLPGFYRHNDGELSPITILDYDGKGNAWVKWKTDGCINLISTSKIIKIDYELI